MHKLPIEIRSNTFDDDTLNGLFCFNDSGFGSEYLHMTHMRCIADGVVDSRIQKQSLRIAAITSFIGGNLKMRPKANYLVANFLLETFHYGQT